jgi:hypothetical protein
LLSGAGNLSNGTIGGTTHGYGPMGGGLGGVVTQGGGQSAQNPNTGGYQGVPNSS